jgi:hypothetical protein
VPGTASKSDRLVTRLAVLRRFLVEAGKEAAKRRGCSGPPLPRGCRPCTLERACSPKPAGGSVLRSWPDQRLKAGFPTRAAEPRRGPVAGADLDDAAGETVEEPPAMLVRPASSRASTPSAPTGGRRSGDRPAWPSTLLLSLSGARLPPPTWYGTPRSATTWRLDRRQVRDPEACIKEHSCYADRAGVLILGLRPFAGDFPGTFVRAYRSKLRARTEEVARGGGRI